MYPRIIGNFGKIPFNPTHHVCAFGHAKVAESWHINLTIQGDERVHPNDIDGELWLFSILWEVHFKLSKAYLKG